MHPKTGKRMFIMLVVVAILIALLAGFNVFKGHMIEQMMAAMASPTQTVSATKATYSSWQPGVDAVATLRAARGADLALDVAGVVSDIAIRSGQEVAKGDLILKLRDDDVSAALAQAQAALSLARTQFERAKKQIKTHTIAQAVFDQAATDLDAKKAAVALQRALLAKHSLRAPFAGRVGILTLSPGAWVNTGTPVITLQQLDPLLADFHLPQKALDQLAVGQSVHLQVQGMEGPAFQGEITAISPKVDPATRNVMIEARIPNPDGHLQPGMFAHVTVDTGTPRQHLTLPQTAISYNPYGATVFVIKDKQVTDESGKTQTVQVVEQHFVETGATRGDQVAIVDGIEAGDQVVTSGQLKLANGTRVRIDNSVVPANNPAPTPVEG